MSNKLKMYIVLCAAMVSCGCKVKTKLNEEDLKWMDVYKVNDTLVFKSQRGELDTSIIIKKEIYYPEYNPVEVHDNYLPQWGVVWYTNKNLYNHPDGYQLVSMFKKAPGKKISLSVNYLYSDFLFSEITPDFLKKFNKGGIYEFDKEASRTDAAEPKTIFWDERYGLIKYMTFGGDVWERINLPGHK